jgi:hypothetical protein
MVPMNTRWMRVAVRLTEEERAALEALALQRDEKPATVARRLLCDAVKAAHGTTNAPIGKVRREA